MANRVCEKCIHYDVCLLHEDNFIDDVAKNGFCGKFKNKSDFVEVVRCKDCKHCWQYVSIDRMHHIECTFDPECNTPIHEMHFCCYGERKEK